MATPHLSYYFGRKVAEIRTGPTDEEWKWQIVLDPAVYIRNLDEEAVTPPESDKIVGTALLTGDLVEDVGSVLQFGFSNAPTQDDPDGSINVMAEVRFPWEGYEIQDATMGDDYVIPDIPVVPEDTLPPDPSDDRVALGPEAPYVEPQEAPGAEKPTRATRRKG